MPLQVEVANVADILAKQGYESQVRQSRKNNFEGATRNHNTSSPGKDRRFREVSYGVNILMKIVCFSRFLIAIIAVMLQLQLQ